jgi:hypothetical protein
MFRCREPAADGIRPGCRRWFPKPDPGTAGWHGQNGVRPWYPPMARRTRKGPTRKGRWARPSRHRHPPAQEATSAQHAKASAQRRIRWARRVRFIRGGPRSDGAPAGVSSRTRQVSSKIENRTGFSFLPARTSPGVGKSERPGSSPGRQFLALLRWPIPGIPRADRRCACTGA